MPGGVRTVAKSDRFPSLSHPSISHIAAPSALLTRPNVFSRCLPPLPKLGPSPTRNSPYDQSIYPLDHPLPPPSHP